MTVDILELFSKSDATKVKLSDPLKFEPGIYVRPNKETIDFPLLERDATKIRERRKELGMEEATKLEKEEIEKAKTIKHEIPKNLLGIGVRIEDDIVCTNKEPINLTEGVPRSVEEIEELCK